MTLLVLNMENYQKQTISPFPIKELSERAHIPHAPHIDRSNAKFLK
jgi:hypothetical protein